MYVSYISKVNSNITFKSRHDKYFANEVEASLHQIIPEYEDIDLDNIREEEPEPDMFREDELFDRRRDYITPEYSIYDHNDVKLCDNIIFRDFMSDTINYSRYVETPSAYDEYFTKPVVKPFVNYTVDCAYKNEHESFQERLNQGFSREEVSSVYHSALVDTAYEGGKRMDLKLSKAGFEVLKSGKSLEDTTKLMENSKLSYADGSTRFNRDLFDFLFAHPDTRGLVVDQHGGYESLRKDIMNVYSEVSEVCKDEKDTKNVLKACQLGSAYRKSLDNELLKLFIGSVQDGVSIKNASDAMRQAKLSQGVRNEEFSRGLYDFLTVYPGTRDLVVEQKGDSEVVRYDIVEMYPKINEVCKNKEDAAEVIDACEAGSMRHKTLQDYFLDECIGKIKNGASVKDAADEIRQAKLYDFNSSTRLDKDLYMFLKKYPGTRDVVVYKTYRTEQYKPDRAEAYEKLFGICSNPDDIQDIILACELKTKQDGRQVNNDILGLAMGLLAKEPEWSHRHDSIIDNVKTYGQGYSAARINAKKFELADAMAKGTYSVDSIYSAVVLNHKNVELMK
ncbi:MAG: hypothetical protein K6E29_03250 [Cyanobacteria bacterium RUI128]|nr:hypothetical protein [Cyanobacteria bacterium RUI128]